MADVQGLTQALNERKSTHLYRTRRVSRSAQGVEVIIDGQHYLNFCSNDYLGLAADPRVIDALKQGATQWGVGSGASHLVCGHSEIHHQLEQALAQFTGRDRALLFSSGYLANLGVINALLGKHDFIFEDKLNHASLLDAGLLSGARFQRFLHNDTQQLEAKLKKAGEGRKLIVVDGVFSMDGDLAPLDKLAPLAEQYGACLMVDDAHGLGVLGETGAGCAEHFHLSQQQLPILMGTLGKSFGCFGAFIAGSEALIETLIQYARSYIYTTALPPAIAAASLASLELIREGQSQRDHLQRLILQFKQGMKNLQAKNTSTVSLLESSTAIQPLLVGDSEKAMAMSEALEQRGVLVSAIRPPTVPVGSARLRVTFSAAHDETHVQRLLDVLAEVLV
ncbi:MAG: 8-amino-7-oxononanoate synthase [Spongiibacteraceae bacterium]|nr:8-amino-7-oxononanoate synthase [Spongiibacteraceae bacterium]